jgi:hypothetical protein
VRDEFQRFERVDVQFLVDAFGEPVAESRHRREQLHGIRSAAQPFELRPAPGARHLEQCGGDATPDAGQSLESGNALSLDDRGQFLGQPEDRVGRPAVGRDPERIGALGVQQVGRLA